MKNKQRSRSDAGAGSGTGRGGGSKGDQESGTQKVRLQRVMADAGVAARRDCETMIEEGRVTVNGEVVRKLPVFVDPEVDDIRVEGRGLRKAERKLYLMVNKPERMLVTNADEPEFDRATIMEIVDHPAKARLFPVGRLDFESAGLVLMTNDGELANMISHPRYQVPKVYEALVRGVADQTSVSAISSKLRAMRKRTAREEGIEGPVAAGPGPEIEIVKYHGGNTLLRITLLEAKNRELRDLLSYLGMPIKKLTRIGIGGLELRGLPLASWRELAREEVHMLRKTRAGYSKRQESLPPPMPPTEAMLQAEREKQARRGGRSGGVMLNDIDRERMEEQMESQGASEREPSGEKPDRKVSGPSSGSGGTYIGGRFGDLMDEVPVKPVRGRVLRMDRSDEEPQPSRNSERGGERQGGNWEQGNRNTDGGGFSGARGRKGGYGGFERRDGGGPRRGRPDPNPNRNAENPRVNASEGPNGGETRGFSGGGGRDRNPAGGPGRGPNREFGERSGERFGGGTDSGTRTRPTFGNRKGSRDGQTGPAGRGGEGGFNEGARGTDRADRGERGSVRGRSSGGFGGGGGGGSDGGSRGGFGPARSNRGSTGGPERGASRGSRVDGGSTGAGGPRGGKPGSKFGSRPTGGKPGSKAGGKPSKGGFKGGPKGGGKSGGGGKGRGS